MTERINDLEEKVASLTMTVKGLVSIVRKQEKEITDLRAVVDIIRISELSTRRALKVSNKSRI